MSEERSKLLEIGVARVDISAFEPGMTMLGWGHPRNTIEGVGMPLHARAVVLRDPVEDRKVAYLCADLCFITLLLRRRVMAALRGLGVGLGEHNTMLTATHTHSGPNGYSGHLYYNISAPGFSDHVFRALADGFTEALREADRRRAPGRVHYHTGEVPLTDAIMFNRSVQAYNRNADVVALTQDRSDEALDRTLRLLRFDDAHGQPIGALSWLPLHPTTIHYENQLLHPDHKGIAADQLEKWAGERHGARDFVAIFAQEASGDVTPNYRRARARGLMVGRHDDDLRSAEHCGEVQARVARRVFEAAPRQGTEIKGPLGAVVRYAPLAHRTVEARFTDGVRERTTTSARIGLAMAQGTDEGPGPLFRLQRLPRWLRERRARAAGGAPAEDPKVPFVDLGLGQRGRLFDAIPFDNRVLLGLPAPAMAHFRKLVGARALGDAWVPEVFPVQLLRLGPLLVAALPCEPTVVAGRRLRATVRAASGAASDAPVLDVVVNGYANAYSSYLCTPEEYQEQHYEAACTLFGPWTLGVYQAELAALAARLAGGDVEEGDLGVEPPPPELAQLGLGRFVVPDAERAGG
jgi:neutral ceramidase